jgi:hypothetical protein
MANDLYIIKLDRAKRRDRRRSMKNKTSYTSRLRHIFNNKYLQGPGIVKRASHLFLFASQPKSDPVFEAVNLNMEYVLESVVLDQTCLPVLRLPPSIIILPTVYFVYLPSTGWRVGPLKSRIIHRLSLTLQFTE